MVCMSDAVLHPEGDHHHLALFLFRVCATNAHVVPRRVIPTGCWEDLAFQGSCVSEVSQLELGGQVHTEGFRERNEVNVQ